MGPANALAWALMVLAAAAALGLVILIGGLARVFTRAPRLAELPEPKPDGPAPLAAASLTVVVPAYNEAANIAACLTSLLSSEAPCGDWRVLLVDDGSTDATAAIAREAAVACGATEPRFMLLDAGPRPAGERWVGKNWACSRAMEQVDSDWVLFVDADVRLQAATLHHALAQARADGADLLSLAPRLSCGCLAEWMVQPIMASLLGLGFPIEAANDPASPVAFAAGPFMLFRRSAYMAIGGHRALAAEVVEDLALARRIKAAGHRLEYLLGLDALELRMYADFAALWEGWTKNWLLGLDGSVAKALGAAAVVLLLFSGPWLLTPAAAIAAALLPAQRLLLLAALALALAGIGLQLALRLWTRWQFQVPLTLWWLMGVGGLVVAAIGPVSVWRTLSGRGWTWKGRSLA
ncbi:glycosyltransferase [Vulcanococcus limneticus Candia 3F8]|uniref:glycosyltransferase n=1 Tax=Vulcanococcus limneticus TaxID=2170428 RepID=UPI000B9972CB|nr:glycosyltransferase family 2 protein [Vulcanococcus limneticus]MCP9792501.1 glycosyltransferase [Vulcanococcus limneticus MW73D5]MCP9894226.1 glycosyltransferase [Vulcanococcus limneticus Candia 3F8]MCP9897849.1 glycosyltransferase [Vulcanococcus limneticus Candia 3B3]